MSKFYGAIGFAKLVETAPDVWSESIVEKNYYGEIQSNFYKVQNGSNLNDNIDINNKLSIISDSFATNSIGAMRYVVWHGEKWKVTSAEMMWPRIMLTIGGVYNA